MIRGVWVYVGRFGLDLAKSKTLII